VVSAGRALLDEALRRGAKKTSILRGTRGGYKLRMNAVTPLTLDVTNGRRSSGQSRGDTLDILLTMRASPLRRSEQSDVLEHRTFAVTFLGLLKVTNAVSPLLMKNAPKGIGNGLVPLGCPPKTTTIIRSLYCTSRPPTLMWCDASLRGFGPAHRR